MTVLAVGLSLTLAAALPGGPLNPSAPPPARPPQTVEAHLTASAFNWTIAPNVTIEVWGYNGQIPGPEIRLREGDTLRATLHNNLTEPTTIHWHGMEVPASQDGVPGLSQDPVLPGANYTYEFVAKHAGTFFYHSHYGEAEQVDRGLAGPLIVEPRGGLQGADREFVIVLDEWAVPEPAAAQQMPSAPAMPPGADMMNMTDEDLAALHGEVHEFLMDSQAAMMSQMSGSSSAHGAAGMNNGSMTSGGMMGMDMTGMNGSMAGHGNATVAMDSGMWANLTHAEKVEHMEAMGAMAEVHAGMADMMGSMSGSTMGMGGMGGSMDAYNYWTINGKSYPLTQPLQVKKGERVLVRIINVGVMQTHPIHLHGHDLQVVATDGHALAQPYYKDTLPVAPGERYDVLVVADNPGVWAFHCHELHHLANGMAGPGGMMTTFAYEGYAPLGSAMPPPPSNSTGMPPGGGHNH